MLTGVDSRRASYDAGPPDPSSVGPGSRDPTPGPDGRRRALRSGASEQTEVGGWCGAGVWSQLLSELVVILMFSNIKYLCWRTLYLSGSAELKAERHTLHYIFGDEDVPTNTTQ